MLNLAASLVALPLLIIALYGGLGALMGFGYFGESLASRYPWIEPVWSALSICWLLGWLFGVAMLTFRFRRLVRRVVARKLEKWGVFDVPLALGHVTTLIGFASFVFPQPWNDSFYFCLMWAGFFYAIGVGLVAVSVPSNKGVPNGFQKPL